MTRSYVAAFGFGLLVFAIEHILYAWLITFETYPVAGMRALYVAPAVAAFIAAYAAPSGKILVGASMAPIGALMSTGMYLLAPTLGLPVDRIGTGMVFVLSLVSIVLPIIAGTAVGVASSKPIATDGTGRRPR